MIFPVYWMISTAFKRDEDVYSLTPTWLPLHPTLRHFSDAIHRPFFWTDVKNSMIVVVFTVAISLVVAFIAAVALAKYRFSGRKLFILLIIGRSEEHTSELQSHVNLVCRLLLEKK